MQRKGQIRPDLTVFLFFLKMFFGPHIFLCLMFHIWSTVGHAHGAPRVIFWCKCRTKLRHGYKAEKPNDAVIVPLRKNVVLHFLLCPILHFMDTPSHAKVSSSHTVEVQSTPGEVRHLPSWEFQNSSDLSTCCFFGFFPHCYASSCSLLQLSSFMLLLVCTTRITPR